VKILGLFVEMLCDKRVKSVCQSYRRYKNQNYFSVYTLRKIMSGHEFRKLKKRIHNMNII